MLIAQDVKIGALLTVEEKMLFIVNNVVLWLEKDSYLLLFTEVDAEQINAMTSYYTILTSTGQIGFTIGWRLYESCTPLSCTEGDE